MSNGPKNQSKDPSASSMLAAIKEPVQVPTATMDNRMVTKMALAQSIFEAAIQSYGLVNMLQTKRAMTRSIIEDVRRTFDMVDEIFDEASN